MTDQNQMNESGMSSLRWRQFLHLGAINGVVDFNAEDRERYRPEPVAEWLRQFGPAAVDEIVDASRKDTSVTPRPAIYALAVAASFGCPETRRRAFRWMPTVCRTSAQLSCFIADCQSLRGWGRGMRKSVAAWYVESGIDHLINQTIQTPAAGGWSHTDLLRLAHPRPETPEQAEVFRWISGREVTDVRNSRLRAILTLAEMNKAEDVAAAVLRHAIPIELVPVPFRRSPVVVLALAESMPIRQILANIELFATVETAESARAVETSLLDLGRIRAARMRPLEFWTVAESLRLRSPGLADVCLAAYALTLTAADPIHGQLRLVVGPETGQTESDDWVTATTATVATMAAQPEVLSSSGRRYRGELSVHEVAAWRKSLRASSAVRPALGFGRRTLSNMATIALGLPLAGNGKSLLPEVAWLPFGTPPADLRGNPAALQIVGYSSSIPDTIRAFLEPNLHLSGNSS